MSNYEFSKVISWSKIQGDAQSFVSRGGSGKISISKVISDLRPIANIMFGIAIAVLIVVGLIMGVKYMISGADERAKLKEKLIWYIIAAILVFGATGIYNIVIGTINSLGI